MFDIIIIIAIKQVICYSDKSSYNTDGLAIIVSVLLALSLLWLNKLMDRAKKRNELVLYKEMIVSWLEYSKNDIITNEKVIKDFSKTIKKIDTLDIENLSIVDINFSKIYSLPLEKVSDALLVNLEVEDSKESSKYLYDLINQIYFFIDFSKQLADIYNEFKSDIAQLSEEWNKTFIPLSMNITDNLKNAKDKEAEFYKIGKEQFSIFNIEHRQRIEDNPRDNNPHLSRCVEICIMPLLNYYNSNPTIQTSIIVDKTLQLIHLINNIIIQHRIYTEAYSAKFLDISRRIEISEAVLFEAVEFFKKNKIKSTSKIKL
jgi:hypothetical protein